MNNNSHAGKIFGFLFKAEVVNLIGSILTVLAAFGVVFAMALNSTALTTVAGLATVAAGIIAFVGGIMSLVGMIQGRSFSRFLTGALLLVIIGVVLTVVASLLAGGAAATVTRGLSGVVHLGVTMFVIAAIQDVANNAGNSELFEKAKKVAVSYCIVTIVAILANTFGGLIGAGTGLTAVINLIYAVCLIVSYVLYMGLLSKASKEL